MRAGIAGLHAALLALGAAGAGSALLQTPAGPKIDFSHQILPILSDKCFRCHGPDSSSRMAGLRLDTPDGAFADRGGRWAIVPGKPEQSLLVQRINHPDAPMPPASSGKTLSAEEKVLLARWIAEGAVYAKLWSFEPLPKSVPPPSVKSAWPRDDLDRFVLARLQKEGLAPSPEAPRWRWLRRVTLDLTGLPPTEAEIDAFEADRRPDAYERVVDRLLASPRYGERLAVEWLDAARYSDSYGYQSDLLMPTWPYRDWVVRAFNENLPYDRFLVDQIAGDRLPNPTRDERLATAFNRLHRQSNEGGSIAEEFKTEYAADRVDTFGTAVLGLTLGCARCHDHKFDPIKQKEYYGLYAYFNSIEEYGLLLSTEIVPTPSLLLPSPEQEKRLAELEAERKAAAEETRRTLADSVSGEKALVPLEGVLRFSLDEKEGAFASTPPGKASGRRLGKPLTVSGHQGSAAQFDGESGIAFGGLGARERWDAFGWSFWIKDPRVKGPVVVLHRTGGTDVGFCGFDLMLEDGRLTARIMRHWPGNAVAVRTKAPIPENAWTQVAWTWDGAGRAEGLRLYVNGQPAETEVLRDRLWKKVNAYGDLGPSGGDWAFAQRFRDAGFKGGAVDDVAFAERPLTPLEVRMLYDGATPDALIREHSALTRPSVLQAKEKERKVQQAIATFEEQIPEISVMEDAPKPVPAYVLARGAYDAPKTDANRAPRGVPAALPPLPSGGENDRLALARWATMPDHPLTARVAVNRFWQMLFGTGLVETSENFGNQGSRPTHSELLDFLARRFVDSGWNTKRLLKEIVLSATYRQDSARRQPQSTIHSPPSISRVDPLNHLLSRGPSGRLSAEMVRDTALAASGLLVEKLGGPPVNPYQPSGLWQEFNTMSPRFVQSKGSDLYRRSLYSTWKRTTPVPSMMLFDANSREACMVRRPTTNTPLQALVLMNDVQFVEAARALAELVLRTQPDDAARLKTAFRRLAGRLPDAVELKVLAQTLEEQRLAFRKDLDGASRLIRVGDSEPDPKLRPSELAAMTVTVQTMLNSDAVIVKR